MNEPIIDDGVYDKKAMLEQFASQPNTVRLIKLPDEQLQFAPGVTLLEKKLTYLASPYSHHYAIVRNTRFVQACRVAGLLFERGVYVYSPIAHTHSIAAYGSLPIGFDFWQAYDTAILECCKEMMILTIDGWHKSKGVLAEIEIARRLGIPIIHIDEEGNPL